MSERSEIDDDDLSSASENSSEDEETPPKATKFCDKRGWFYFFHSHIFEATRTDSGFLAL